MCVFGDLILGFNGVSKQTHLDCVLFPNLATGKVWIRHWTMTRIKILFCHLTTNFVEFIEFDECIYDMYRQLSSNLTTSSTKFTNSEK